MKRVNLMPQVRRHAKARKARIVRWSTALGTYGFLLLVGYVASVHYVKADTRPLDTEARELDSKLATTKQTVAALSRELAQVQAKLRTAQSVGQQPDWSRLLALLAQNTSENIVLDVCRLRRVAKADAPAAPGAPKADPSADSRLVLELDGFAKSQSNVPEYVLRLEEVGLFDKVKLVKTSRQDFLKNKTVAFSLECTFRTGGGKRP
ncbi:MAG: PilN domain-containing protein [Phycisphaerae bacterium]|nr:PilN domain-containing protein [Phycisphaerae bacterium]